MRCAVKVRWKPDSVVPFVGVCWWGGQVIVSLWPLVGYLGKPTRGVQLWSLRVEDGHAHPGADVPR